MSQFTVCFSATDLTNTQRSGSITLSAISGIVAAEVTHAWLQRRHLNPLDVNVCQ